MLELIHNKCCEGKRDPVKTRENLLQSAYQQIHEHGFQSVSLDAILQDAGVTKGALYHHFPNKNALGYAVVEEIIAPTLAEFWINPVIDSDNPINALQQIVREAGDTMTMDELKMGCPLNNLSQEMSSTDEGFRQRLADIYEGWREGLSNALQNGKKNQTVADHVNTTVTAAFIVSSLEGCIGMAKTSQDMNILIQCGQGILDYLETLRAQT
jgi:AcrR family transcriptional regulator